MQRPRIEVDSLDKSYGPVNALVNVTLQVGSGTVLGVLGHNGAGKTTLIDVLATRTRPTRGRAAVCGWDVVKSGHQVRKHIGMTGQFVALDDAMSGYANLVLIARLLGASTRQARARADELIDTFGLVEAADRRPVTYSGGMRRRLDLAASLIGRPEVLFLDEPTTGLDPISRSEVWTLVEKLAVDGTTVILTTQDLMEAERLANDIVVLAAGNIVASGTPEQLKAGLGQRTATVTFANPMAMYSAVAVFAGLGMSPVPNEALCSVNGSIPAPGDIATLVRALDAADLEIQNLTVTEPTLNDVYVALHRSGWKPG